MARHTDGETERTGGLGARNRGGEGDLGRVPCGEVLITFHAKLHLKLHD